MRWKVEAGAVRACLALLLICLAACAGVPRLDSMDVWADGSEFSGAGGGVNLHFVFPEGPEDDVR